MGGEPLLEFNNIKDIVEFSKQLFNGWELVYVITTNLTLLNREMIDFFTEFSRLLADLVKRRFSSLGAACLFNARLFLDAEGRFHICEKMNDKFPFGNVWEGLDYRKMVRIVKSYIEVISKKCNHCEIRYLCPRCYPFFAKDGRFEIDKDFCKDIKVTIIQKLEDLIRLKEEGLMA